MIIYIHGFGGSGEGSKAKAFRAYFKSIDEPFIAPSLSHVPELAIKTLEELIDSYYGDVKLIGSSMGGYYTMYLAEKYDVQAVLINPSIQPTVTLKRAIGQAPSFYDESHFEWNTKHLEMLKHYQTEVTDQNKLLLMVQKGDDLLNYQEAIDFLPDAEQLVEEGGNHSFDNIEQHFEKIRAFFAIGNYFKHTMKPKGVGLTNNLLAERLGDLYYDALGDLLANLAHKLNEDAKADENRGRKRLADNLYASAYSLENASASIHKAWGNCEVHTLKWLDENGSNRVV
jgi:hypothetical protein